MTWLLNSQAGKVAHWSLLRLDSKVVEQKSREVAVECWRAGPRGQQHLQATSTYWGHEAACHTSMHLTQCRYLLQQCYGSRSPSMTYLLTVTSWEVGIADEH